MNNQTKIKIPKSLTDILSQENGFSFDEILPVLELPENKKFLEEIKPLIIETLKKEFPIISMFL